MRVRTITAATIAVVLLAVVLYLKAGSTPADCGTFRGSDGQAYRITGPAGSDCTVPAGQYVAPSGRAFTITPR